MIAWMSSICDENLFGKVPMVFIYPRLPLGVCFHEVTRPIQIDAHYLAIIHPACLARKSVVNGGASFHCCFLPVYFPNPARSSLFDTF